MEKQNELAGLLLAKLREQVERTEHLLDLIPAGRLNWRPELPPSTSEARSLGMLLGHLLDCLAGFCATLYALDSKRLSHFARLRDLPVNHNCAVEEARERTRQYMAHIEEGFALLTDADLARRIPTVFAPGGEAAFTILLGNLEHLINHKHQLFFCLKLLGVPVSTGDLYRLRGESAG